MELEREIAKAKRTKSQFVLAFIDVDGLKTTNDSHGHGAGDELLRHVMGTIRARVRAYDLRSLRGDESLCGLTDVPMAEAVERFALVNEDLASSRHASVTAGIAELRMTNDSTT